MPPWVGVLESLSRTSGTLSGCHHIGRFQAVISAGSRLLHLNSLCTSSFNNTHLHIYSDSDGAIRAHSKGWSSNSKINLCVRQTYAASTASLLIPSLAYIESALNPADQISCGIINLPLDKHLTCQFKLPLELTGLFIDHHVRYSHW